MTTTDKSRYTCPATPDGRHKWVVTKKPGVLTCVLCGKQT